MKQTKLESIIEKSIDIGSGFFIALFLQHCIMTVLSAYPFLLEEYQNYSTLAVTIIFTITSFVRSYFWRRFFNNEIHRVIHLWLKKKMIK